MEAFIAKLEAEAEAYTAKAAVFTEQGLTEAAELATAVAAKLTAWAQELKQLDPEA